RRMLAMIARAAPLFPRGLAWAFLALLAATPAVAQTAAPVKAPARAAAAPAPPAAAPAAVSADELERLVGALQDDAQRARLVEQLRGLIAAQRGQEPEEPGDPATLLGELSAKLDAITGDILVVAATVVDLPRLYHWIEQQLGDAASRERWLEAALKLGVIFGFALFAEWAVRALLARPRARLTSRPGDNIAVR